MLYKFAEEKLVLGVDIDNVLNNFQEVMGKLVKRKLKKEPDITNYDLYHGLNMNDSQRHEFYKENQDWINNNMKVEWRASFYMEKIKQKYKIVIITARHFDVAPETTLWLEEHSIPYDEIHFNTGDKVDACKFLNVEYMVEDSPWNLRKLNKEGIKTLIYNQPFNQKVSETELATRVNNWEDIYNFLILQGE